MKVAALDLGSNSFLCLIVEGNDGKIQKIIKDESRVVKLGQGLESSGELHPDALIRAEETLKEFRKILDENSPDVVKAVATAAVREAKNKNVFFDLLKKYNIPLQILSGNEEAEMSFRGTVDGADKTLDQILIDIGGGSTEVIWGQNNKIQWSHSFPIGAVKLTERFIKEQPLDLAHLPIILEYLDGIFLPKLKKLNVEKCILKAVAGTPTSLAGVMLGGYDSVKVDGFKLTKKDLQTWIPKFAETSIEEKKIKFQLGARSEVILAGCILLEYLRKYFEQDSITVSVRGVRYGLALSLL